MRTIFCLIGIGFFLSGFAGLISTFFFIEWWNFAIAVWGLPLFILFVKIGDSFKNG